MYFSSLSLCKAYVDVKWLSVLLNCKLPEQPYGRRQAKKEIWLNFVIYLFQVLLMIDETVVIGRLVYVIILLLPFRCFS